MTFCTKFKDSMVTIRRLFRKMQQLKQMKQLKHNLDKTECQQKNATVKTNETVETKIDDLFISEP